MRVDVMRTCIEVEQELLKTAAKERYDGFKIPLMIIDDDRYTAITNIFNLLRDEFKIRTQIDGALAEGCALDLQYCMSYLGSDRELIYRERPCYNDIGRTPKDRFAVRLILQLDLLTWARLYWRSRDKDLGYAAQAFEVIFEEIDRVYPTLLDVAILDKNFDDLRKTFGRVLTLRRERQ